MQQVLGDLESDEEEGAAHAAQPAVRAEAAHISAARRPKFLYRVSFRLHRRIIEHLTDRLSDFRRASVSGFREEIERGNILRNLLAVTTHGGMFRIVR